MANCKALLLSSSFVYFERYERARNRWIPIRETSQRLNVNMITVVERFPRLRIRYALILRSVRGHARVTHEREDILDFSNLLWMNSSSFFFFLHIISVFTFFTICEKIIYSKFIDFSLKLERSMEDLKVKGGEIRNINVHRLEYSIP